MYQTDEIDKAEAALAEGSEAAHLPALQARIHLRLTEFARNRRPPRPTEADRDAPGQAGPKPRQPSLGCRGFMEFRAAHE